MITYDPSNKCNKKHNQSLIDMLPGHNTWIIEADCDKADVIAKRLNQIPDEYDTIIITTVDIWISHQFDPVVLKYNKLKNKKIFIATVGYQNYYLGCQIWKLAYPSWYIGRKLPEYCEFYAKPTDLTYGFGSLNNRPAWQRLLLGHRLHESGVLSNIIWTQNNWGQQSNQTGSYPLGEVQGTFDFCKDTPGHPLMKLFSKFPNYIQYQKLLPILWQDQPISNRHDVHHDAELNAYAYICTEAFTEDIGIPNRNMPIMSEKSWRPFASGQIPIFFAATGHLPFLKHLGFELMEDLVPLGFDDMNTVKKIEVIVSIVSRGRDFIKDFYFNHLREIKHNYELVFSDKVDQLILSDIQKCIQHD